MGWLVKFLTSSIGQKLIMALTGIFLLLFLTVHLAGNLQLVFNSDPADAPGLAFNTYAEFMGENPFIQTVSIGNFFFIALHAVVGLVLWFQNRAARGGQKYAVQKVRAVNTNAGFAKNMAVLGTVLLIFIVIHLYQFWFQSKFGFLPTVTHDGNEMGNLYGAVAATYTNLGFVVFYVVCMLVLAFHLWHGFQSAFQTLGLNHQKYTPAIQFLGKAYSIIIPFGFAIIPIIFYFKNG